MRQEKGHVCTTASQNEGQGDWKSTWGNHSWNSWIRQETETWLQEARRMPYRVDPERVTGSQVRVLRPQRVHVEGRPRGAGGSGVSGLTGEARERCSLPASPGHMGGQRSERTPASGTTSNGRPPCAPWTRPRRTVIQRLKMKSKAAGGGRALLVGKHGSEGQPASRWSARGERGSVTCPGLEERSTPCRPVPGHAPQDEGRETLRWGHPDSLLPAAV